MVEAKNNKVNYLDNKKKGLLGPILFLVIVILITIGLYIYSTYIQKQTYDIKQKVTSMNQTANELQSKPEIQVYSLIESNKRTLDELEKRSIITTYLNHFKYIQEEYKITLEGFSLSKGEIRTSAIVESDEELAFTKTSNFIQKYREDENAILELNFIDLVEGMDTMKYNLSFTIK